MTKVPRAKVEVSSEQTDVYATNITCRADDNKYFVGQMFNIFYGTSRNFILTRNASGMFLVDLVTGSWWFDPIKTKNRTFADAEEIKEMIGHAFYKDMVRVKRTINFITPTVKCPLLTHVYIGTYFLGDDFNVYLLVNIGNQVSLMAISSGELICTCTARVEISFNCLNKFISIADWNRLCSPCTVQLTELTVCPLILTGLGEKNK
jgi:hypothetical protein